MNRSDIILFSSKFLICFCYLILVTRVYFISTQIAFQELNCRYKNVRYNSVSFHQDDSTTLTQGVYLYRSSLPKHFDPEHSMARTLCVSSLVSVRVGNVRTWLYCFPFVSELLIAVSLSNVPWVRRGRTALPRALLSSCFCVGGGGGHRSPPVGGWWVGVRQQLLCSSCVCRVRCNCIFPGPSLSLRVLSSITGRPRFCKALVPSGSHTMRTGTCCSASCESSPCAGAPCSCFLPHLCTCPSPCPLCGLQGPASGAKARASRLDW